MLFIVIAAFFVCWGIGSQWGSSHTVARVANRYVVTVALPALVFSRLVEADFTSSMLIPVVSSWIVMAACVGCVFLAAHIFRWDTPVVGVLLLVAVLGNTSFLGIGMVRALLGDPSVPFAISYDQLGTFVALATYGAWVAKRYGSHAVSSRSVVRQLATFPPFLALVAAFALRGREIPSVVLDVLGGVGVTVAPVAMGALGLRFTLTLDRSVLPAACVGLAVKMVIVPMVCVAYVLMWGSSDDVAWAATALQAAAPPMVTAGVVAVDAGMDESLSTFVVGVGTIVGFGWLPLVSLMV